MEEHKKHNHRDNNDEEIAKSLEAQERNHERRQTFRMNRLWIWLGVIVLIAILLWWIFSIGFFEDTSGYTNFGN